MESETVAPPPEVPVKPAQPDDGAPPSAPEPASAAVPEMSGALPTDSTAEPKPAETTGEPFLISPRSYKLIGWQTDTTTANGPVDPVPEPPAEPQEPVADPAPEPEAEPAAPAAVETEPKEADEADEADAAPAETNGTADDKKTSLKRKSSSAAAGKKLNKKKSMSKIVTHLNAEAGDYFLARLKGYPPWPSIICDEEMLPASLIKTRPKTTKKPDGSYEPAYADGGKRENERTFPIMFLGTNEL